MERLLATDRVYALAAATAHEFNDELTVILSSVTASIRATEPGHPARRPLLELERAALRCASTSSRLLNFGARRGPRVARTSLKVVLGD